MPVLSAALDLPGFVLDINAGGRNVEHELAALRGAALVAEGCVEQLRGSQALTAARVQQLMNAGATAVSEFDVLISAFREEAE